MRLKVNKYILLLDLIVLLNLNCFYLIEAGKFHIGDLTIIIELLFSGITFLEYGFSKRRSRYGVYIGCSVIFVTTSAIAAYYSYDQPILLGIRPQRFWIMSLLMYFPIQRLIKENVLPIGKIIKNLEYISCIYACLIIVQWLLPDIMFMKVITSDRYGSVRLFVSMTYLTILYFIELVNFFQRKKLTKVQYFIIASTLFISVFITKSRMRLLLLGICTLLMAVVDKKTVRKLKIMSAGALCAICAMVTPYGLRLLNSFIDKSVDPFNREIREIGQTFYLERIFSSVRTAMIGVGYMNTQWEPSVIGTRYKEHISYDDNGMVGLMFYYGVIFAIWAILFSVKLIRDAYKAKSFALMLYIINGLIGIYTLFPACYSDSIAFALVCGIVEYNYGCTAKNIRERKEALHLYEGAD